MKKFIVYAFFSVTILGGLVIGLAQAKSNNAMVSPGINFSIAQSPWYVQYIHRVVAPDPLDLGKYNSIAINPNDHLPYISYYDNTNHDLMLASPATSGTGNCGANGNWWCRVIDGDGLEGRSSDDMGQYNSLAFWKSTGMLLVWKLGISYYDATTYSLHYAVYTCTGLICNWERFNLLTGNDTYHFGLYSSLKFDSDGHPHIAAYTENTTGGADDLRYFEYLGNGAGDCGPFGDWHCDGVDSGDGVGQYASLDLGWDDQVYIAYYHQGLQNLRYAYHTGSGNCGWGMGWTCVMIDGTGTSVGEFPSLIAPQNAVDIFRVAYYDRTNHQLRYARSGMGSSGNCGPGNSWQCNAVDNMKSITPVGISMKLDNNGYPVIAYQYSSDQPQSHTLLSIARPYFIYDDSNFGNCGEMPPGYVIQFWRCTILDPAGAYTNEADYVSMAIDLNGLVAISYSENDDYYGSTSLKLARQNLLFYLPITLQTP